MDPVRFNRAFSSPTGVLRPLRYDSSCAIAFAYPLWQRVFELVFDRSITQPG